MKREEKTREGKGSEGKQRGEKGEIQIKKRRRRGEKEEGRRADSDKTGSINE